MRRVRSTTAATHRAAGRVMGPARESRVRGSTASQYLDLLQAFQVAPDRGHQGAGVPLSLLEAPLGGEQAVADAQGPLPSLGRQVAVAGTQGQSVRLPHRGRHQDVHGQVQVLHHPADDGGLLQVLLAEEGQVRLHQVEQLGDHRGHPAEMARTEPPAQGVAHGPHFDGRAEAGGIDLRRLGNEQDGHPQAQAQVLVPLQVPGIPGQVLPGAELGGVHEHRNHRGVAPGRALADQGGVPFVQVAHGGDEADALAALAHGLEGDA